MDVIFIGEQSNGTSFRIYHGKDAKDATERNFQLLLVTMGKETIARPNERGAAVLINKNWAVTSAGMFTEEGTNVIEKDRLKLSGGTNYMTTGNKDRQDREFAVEGNVHINPDYTGVPGTGNGNNTNNNGSNRNQ